jgi:S1-C subfamily serine protease
VTNPLMTLSEHLASTVEQSGRSIVAIHARARFNSSGVHWSPGVVVTADHTIQKDDDIRVTGPDGSTHPAELAGRDPSTDLAVLRVKDLNIPVATKAGGSGLKPGNTILVVGRFKDSVSAAFGVLSSVSGPSQTWRGGRLDQVLRLDVALHAGAAGGAVVDADGKLIGIASPALSRVAVFAIPVATVDRVTEKLLIHGRIPRGYLGVGLQPIAIPEHLKNKLSLPTSSGLIAVSVDADAPAGQAGILIGDILLELAGRAMHRPENVQEVLDSESIGKKLAARILRAGNTMDVELTVGERPARR